jgi:NtrC-family two-component system sensor histidine kinase KinB
VKIKAKLFLGIGLLFAMIALLTVLSSVFIHRLANDSKNILTDNYNSVDYCRQMLNALNKGISDPVAAKEFELNLAKQQMNETEVGEKDLTDKLAADFENIKNSTPDTLGFSSLEQDLTAIMLLNMQSIQRKNFVAQSTADSSILWVSFAGAICFLIALTLLFNLPGNIGNPVKELTTSIKEIAAENYSQRVHFDNRDEFGELAEAFNTMAEKLEEFKAANLESLFMEKKRIETLINNLKDPVIGLDENKKIIFMNNVALKIAGLSAENVIGKAVQDIAMHNDLMRILVQELFDKNLQQNKARPLPVKIYADNKESYFEKEIIPIKIIPTGEKEEKQIGTVILLQNITPYKELDFAKTNFIATVSHELKTPIASIKMSLELLKNKKIGELNSEQDGLIESIRDDAARLLKITGELLNMSQVESGVIQMNLVPSDPGEIVDVAINSNRSAAEQKQISFKINLPENLPRVLADNEKSSWVLNNLLSNAIRYSYDNSVIFIDVKNEDKKIHFSVTDTGQGIAPQYVDKVFDRYFRIPGTKKEGTGLGLSISKEFMEAQGGQLYVNSEFGAGSVFSFTLNIAPFSIKA